MGIVEQIVGTEDRRVVVEVEDCQVGGSHMFFLETVVDVRRMYDSLKFHPQPLLYSQIADRTCNSRSIDQIAQIDHSVKADYCRTAEHVDADQHKPVRFYINIDTNNDKTTTQRRREMLVEHNKSSRHAQVEFLKC